MLSAPLRCHSSSESRVSKDMAEIFFRKRSYLQTLSPLVDINEMIEVVHEFINHPWTCKKMGQNSILIPCDFFYFVLYVFVLFFFLQRVRTFGAVVSCNV